MKKKAIGKPAKGRKPAPVRALAPTRVEDAFAEVATLIQNARHLAWQAVNTELVGLYWQVGEYISRKLASAEWGDGVVDELARYLARTQPGLRGFTRRNLFRMRQFYETYRDNSIVSPLVTQLPWTHNLIILSQSKRAEEREFYLRMAIRERWSKRELERQLRAALFERAVLSPPKVSPLVRRMHAAAAEVFKDAYVIDFLQLPAPHSESDLHRGLNTSMHLRNVFWEGDLRCEATVQSFLTVRPEGTRQVSRQLVHDNLDAIISAADKAAQPNDFDQAIRALPAAKPAGKKKRGTP